jgi:hypothetical protein
MQSTNVILALLEEEKLIADAFADEDAAGVLLNNGFLVLFSRISCTIPKSDSYLSMKERMKRTE